ncbi:hypothetical protein JCM5296_003891 [Sporobolomyces johnsonii]
MSSDPVASSSSSLDASLDPTLNANAATQPARASTPDDSEPIPTLAALLLSTAESLVSRSTSIAAPPLAKSTSSSSSSATFTLASTPQSLLSHPTASAYLASLLSQPLSSLQSLPTHLSSLSTSLDNDLSSLAFARYSSFLLSHSAAQSIATSFATLSDSLSSLLDSTADLEDAASAFQHRVHAVTDKRERMSRVRDRVEEVDELLDAPDVVDACVRAGYWSEAIQVAARIEELHQRMVAATASSPGQGHGALKLLVRVRDEVGQALLSLRARVLESLLQRSLKLPGAVRGIGILRRIAERGLAGEEAGEAGSEAAGKKKELDEDALRVVFLAARWRCLRTELESVEAQMAASGIQLGGKESAPPQMDSGVSVEENDERTRWTKRWIEVWREIVGETVGMYTEVFLSPSALSHAPSATAPTIDDFHVPSHTLDPSAPLHLFLSTALTSLSSTLSSALPALTSPASLSSLLTQLSYCSHSFARHGLDFREVLDLRQRVELRIGRITVAEWELAGQKWEKEWRDGWESSGAALSTIAAKARRSGRTPIADWLVVPEGLAAVLSTPLPDPPSSLTAPSHQAWHHQPSPALSLLPPLARFLNAHATSLNSLRLLPPLSLYPSLRAAQARELDRATQVLAAFTDAWWTSFNATPLPRPTAVFPSSSHDKAQGKRIDDELLTDEEKQLVGERDDEKRLVVAAIAWFGRAVVPWCEGALERGVYGELAGNEGEGEGEGEGRARFGAAAGREDGVVGAARRAERLLARIEGREWVDPDAGKVGDQSGDADRGRETNGEPAVAVGVGVAELPVVLEVPPVPPPSASTTTNGDSSLLDLSIPPVDADVDAPQSTEDINNAPYLVGEIAPPRPAPADRASKVDEGVLSREGEGQGKGEGERKGRTNGAEEEGEEE